MNRSLRFASAPRLSRRGRLLFLFTTVCALALLWIGMTPAVTRAQEGETVGVYVVAPGDTLSAIAARYDLPLDAITQLNNITDPALIQVGQELLIPTRSSALALGVVETATSVALPGESLAGLSARVGAEPSLIAALNNISPTARLWPGMPLLIPAAQAEGASLRFGAVERVTVPAQIEQGRTGRIQIESRRPLSLTLDWNGLALEPVALAIPATNVETLLPTPALIAPGVYTFTVAYTAANGVDVRRTWPVEIVDGGYAFQSLTLPADKSETLDATAGISETELLSAVYAPITTNLTWRSAFNRPIGPEFATTSPFGTRRTYNDGVLNGFHGGQDFGAPEGTPVTAPADGVVVLAQPLVIRGNAVVVDHGQGVYTGYWHLSEMNVEAGQAVSAGDVLGLVGNTGRSTGAHLHWELRIRGIAVDPLQFLDEALFTPES
ncbi:MAG: peptidoglycan DD-metalloendopeptidase family protein [Caldilineaceae bacterium]|nr:peptidoglycan DD-metalloendopeptidase family protein [Caldilineaceae bacterium]